MDRLNQLRNEAGGSRDSTLDTSSPPSEAYLTANDSSKYFTLLEDDSNFGIKDVEDPEAESTVADNSRIISNLSPIPKKSDLDSYKIGEQIEAANILSGGVDIFDDNDNSYDENELVIDDNVSAVEDPSNLVQDITEDNIIPSGTEETEEDNSLPAVTEVTPVRSKDTEVLLQIDGNNVDAIDIGNGLYLYRRVGEEDLAAVQILDNTKQQSNFKFLKVRENAEGNLEVYEEIEVEVPAREGQSSETMSVPNQETNRVVSEPVVAGPSTQDKEATSSEVSVDLNRESQSEPKMEVNLNGKTMKFSESRKSPVVGSYTPMTFHSTPNKEGIPLTKTMVDKQLHPSRHSDNVKKTIEVHTDHSKQRIPETPTKTDKDISNVPRITKLEAIDGENNKMAEPNLEQLDKSETSADINSQDNIIIDDLCETKPVEAIIERPVEISKSDEAHIGKEDDSSEIVTVNLTTDEPLSVSQERDTKINDLINKNENLNYTNNVDGENNTSEVNDVSKTNKCQKGKENDSKLLKNEGNQPTDLKTDLPSIHNRDSILDSKSNIPVEMGPNTKNIIRSVSKNEIVSNVDKNETKSPVLDDDKSFTTENVSDQNKMDETELNESKVNKNISIENVADVTKISETQGNKSNLDKNNSMENVSVLSQISESKELNEDEKVSIGNIPNENKKHETKLEELDDNKNSRTGNVLDENKISETKSATLDLDKIVTNDSVSKVNALSDVTKLNDSKNVNIGNVLDENKKEETNLIESHVEKIVTIGNVPDMKKTSETKLKELNKCSNVTIGNVDVTSETELKELNECSNVTIGNIEEVVKSSEIKSDKGVVNENVTEITKMSEGKITETNEEKNVSIVDVPNVSEIDKMKSKGCIKDTEKDSFRESKISGTIMQCNLRSKEQIKSYAIKNANNAPKSDPTATKNSTEYKTFKPLLNIPGTKNVLSTAKDCNNLSSKNVVPKKLPGNEKSASVNLIAKPGPSTNLIPNEDNSSVKKPNAEKSITITVDKQSTEKNIQPFSKSIGKMPDAKVMKCEEHLNKEKTVANQNTLSMKNEAKKEVPKISQVTDTKPVINNNAAVPFGKWTEANRQAFLNKIKETKVPTTNSNTKQIKQPNDLNRRDILQKIDSQRQQQSNNAMAKVQEQQKLNNKNEATAFVKSTTKQDSKIPVKERPTAKPKATIPKKVPKDEPPVGQSSELPNVAPNSNTQKKESTQRREINNQALIDKTIEEIINRTPSAKNSNEEPKQNVPNTEGIEKQKGMTLFGPSYHAQNEQSVTLDDIEMKMNELHGIPFVERPAHELPQKFVIIDNTTQNNDNPNSPVPNVEPNTTKKTVQPSTEEVLTLDSDEEILEHEPITGDINPAVKPPELSEKAVDLENNQVQKTDRSDGAKKDVIITEKDFDKFFRRNSVTYENRLTVNFDGKEPHNVIQTIVEKDVAPKKLTRNEVLLAESKAKSTHKQQMLQARQNNHPPKMPTTTKYQASEEESYGKNYQSKVQIAYQSALTAKRQKESPITIIEDKPVKVVFMDSNVDFPAQVNFHSDKLSPIKKPTPDLETLTQSTNDSLDSDILDNFDAKSQDDGKIKTKHQRKQVLTPVETPEMELIEPSDLGIEVSPKKKRKYDDKFEKSPKNHVPKKSYLLGRTVADDKTQDDSNKTQTQDRDKVLFKEITTHNNPFSGQLNSISAIDNLVKAAEMLENQAESNCSSIKTQDSDSQQSTPVKRGRGRPRKYPLPDGDTVVNKSPSPLKKPRLIDAKIRKREETDDDDTSDDEIIKENWTMGKINEDIVCPICGKLFRSENVVFKHVKHCTGPSPNRSESDKRRYRESQESETRSHTSKSDDMEIEEFEPKTPKKRKSKESEPKATTNSDEVIIIEDTPLKEKPERQRESRKSTVKTKFIPKPNSNLVCEICGKTFRQASYLAHHKLSHKHEELKKQETAASTDKSVFSCEVCKKEFRKLHHLVQHRIIHNSNPAPSRTLRKSSSEQGDMKAAKDHNGPKPTEDQSAGFRCEPCDKSFRKLHHLVEHRETHDGINRQKATEVESVKPNPTHQCDMCDKTFKKLTSLNEHKEQHLETCSEKSDDKSVKSSLSTKDIIHECSLCYMVFPNEHSLNKHTVICIRKKKQSAAKAKQAAENKELGKETVESENLKSERCDPNDTDDSLIIVEDNINPVIKDVDENKSVVKAAMPQKQDSNKDKHESITKVPKKEDPIEPINLELIKKSSESKEKEKVKTLTASTSNKDSSDTSRLPTKPKHADSVTSKPQSAPAVKKKTPIKEKVAVTVTKRHRTVNVPLPVVDEVKLATESSDEDEIRYMLNPDFKEEETAESKNFMKVKAKKRSSLQIERPSSRDLVKRRISLQHPPKISRLKAKSTEQKPNLPSTSLAKPTVVKTEKFQSDPTLSTDSDDSDVKYSFPVTKDSSVSGEKEVKKPQKRKSLTVKRKTLGGVAKRKSVGKAINSKHKVNASPVKPVKKRTTEVEHRCDCGQLFSSAALLSRHTTLDHTPPRIRRRRSPEPAKSERARASQSTDPPKAKRKSTNEPKPTAGKGRRSTLKGPVPEKVRKLDKSRP